MKTPITDIIILAAGLGTRMKSDLPKVLHKVAGEPMLGLLMSELDRAIDPKSGARFNIVVGHGREQVIEMVKAMQVAGRVKAPVIFTVQEQQLGTGHAVKLALEQPSHADQVAVFNGDLPLFTAECFTSFLEAHLKDKSAASLASTTLPDAGAYGRVLRKGKAFVGVVESKDANPAQKKIREINGGVYLFDRKVLVTALSKTTTKNKQREYYLPDVFAGARKLKKRVLAFHFDDDSVLAGANNMKELAEVQSMYYRRIAEMHMTNGVFVQEPGFTYIGPNVKIGRGSIIGPFTSIQGSSTLGERVRIGSHCDLNNVEIGDGTLVRNGCVADKTSMGKDCAVGPMAHFRPGTKLLDDVRVGNFVEVKESTIGSHTNAAHLSYIGDAEIGARVNLGCGFITCNFDGTVKDGRRKHRTVIGDNVFVGSDSQVVAPIEIASGTYIASGSSVTESVLEEDSLVIGRSRQVTKAGYAKKYRTGGGHK